MSRNQSTFRNLARSLIEAIARIVIGEPACVIRKRTLDRLVRLAYRQQLREAEAAGNYEFIASEFAKQQLTPADLARIARHHTPIQDWPDEGGEELLHESAYAERNERCDTPATISREPSQLA